MINANTKVTAVKEVSVTVSNKEKDYNINLVCFGTIDGCNQGVVKVTARYIDPISITWERCSDYTEQAMFENVEALHAHAVELAKSYIADTYK